MATTALERIVTQLHTQIILQHFMLQFFNDVGWNVSDLIVVNTEALQPGSDEVVVNLPHLVPSQVELLNILQALQGDCLNLILFQV